ncbi:MAG: hypothetical protein NTW78_02085 [Campylobacterales bacterium]|nr:hypothetical protein [Campylobacterales bacterium]
MFLNRLNETEKVAFLELAHYMARSDGNVSGIEEDMISGFCMEMQINDIEYDRSQFDIYSTLGKIKDKRSRKIVILEIMAIIYADNFLHEEERKVLEKMLEEFDLSYHFSTVYGEWAKAMLALHTQGNALIEL